MQLRGACHCGDLRLRLDWPGEGDPLLLPARACGCSFCRKHGAAWTSHPQARLRVERAPGGRIAEYRFGTQSADFHVCTRCGVAPVVSCRLDERLLAVVNVNCLEGEGFRLQTEPASFEGEELAGRLARRQRNWIADVVFAG